MIDDVKEYIKFRDKIKKEIINLIYDKYIIMDRQGNFIDKNNLKLENDNTRCIGVLSNYKQCSKNAIKDNDYCKIHLSTNKKSLYHNKQVDESLDADILIQAHKERLNVSKNLKKQFIEDTFYWIDDKYIYDIDSYEKVGIIENDEFKLTSDPYLLNILS